MTERAPVHASGLLPDLVARRARDNRNDAFCYFEDDVITFGDLDAAATRLAAGLAQAGIAAGDRVGVMLPSHPDHIYTLVALARLGATHVPLNTQLKADGIKHVVENAEITTVIADRRHQETLPRRHSLLWDKDSGLAFSPSPGGAALPALSGSEGSQAKGGGGRGVRSPLDPNHVAMILYTSGTTGPQKGVMLTDRMYQTAARNAGIAADVRPGDVLFLWEPLHHVAGVQTVILCVQQGIACAMVERFSASRFWDQVRRYQATQIHYLGGVLSLLLKQPERADDATNPVRIAYGAPAPPDIWTRFERRFGVRIHECYGMTEASSFTTINLAGKVGSIGKPVDEFEVRIVDEEDRPLPPGKVGEIVQRERLPGVLMQGYVNDPDATRAAFRNGWFHSGDLGSYDADGFYYFAGRRKDTIRHRGENVSAWVVERAAGSFPHVEECAAVGVPSETGEEEIKLFVRPAAGQRIDPGELVRWCAERLARYEVPRYVEFISEFPKTPSERIRKAELSRATADCWDRDREEGRGKGEE